jgi:hypothetical protein
MGRKIPNPNIPAYRQAGKPQTNPKFQIQIAQTRPLVLDFGDWKLFGISDLEFKEY